ncbi:hypothetical protein HDU91_006402 [Kappamyces sp. JEL0680]|nr:hypothetical protein HDU91_006402 [Kappamyces sp. JEL0680]
MDEQKTQKKVLKRKSGGDINKAADALVAQALVATSGNDESGESDVLALISIRNQQIPNRKATEKAAKAKRVVPFLPPTEPIAHSVFAKAASAPFPERKIAARQPELSPPLASVNMVPDPTDRLGPAMDLSASFPPSVSRPADIDSALTVIARLEIALSEQANQSIEEQSVLRRELDAVREQLAENITVRNALTLECNKLRSSQHLLSDQVYRQKESSDQMIALQKKLVVFEQKASQFEALHTALETCTLEKQKLTILSGQLQDQLHSVKGLFDKKTKEWVQRLQSQQDSHTTQILGLSSEMDSLQREWKKKVERLDGDLKREKYEKDSLQLQLKLKQVQCEKSDKEAFTAKTMLNQANDEIRILKTSQEKLVRQYSESQATVRDLQEMFKKADGKSAQNDSNLAQIVQHLTQKVRELERSNSALQGTVGVLREAVATEAKEKVALQELADRASSVCAERDSLLEQLAVANDSISSLERSLAEKSAAVELQEKDYRDLRKEFAALTSRNTFSADTFASMATEQNIDMAFASLLSAETEFSNILKKEINSLKSSNQDQKDELDFDVSSIEDSDDGDDAARLGLSDGVKAV